MLIRRIVLWDIDHTLIDTRGVGRELSAFAFEQVTGIPMREQAKIDGITEPVIFRETAKLHGLTTSREKFEEFARALTEAHLVWLATLRARGHALPGAAAAQAALAAAPGVVQTVVTGNVRGVAKTKLQVFGLDRHIAWGIGAFGEDDDTRAELIRIALERASEAFDERIAPTDAVVIGDTPADVEAALENAVPVVAVASGKYSIASLREAGAELVLPDLTDVAALLACVDRHSEELSP